MKKFKPQLITNDPISDDAPFPRLISEKRHGICVIIMKGYDKILGRSLKPIKNIQFQERFKPLVDYCNEHNCMIQGEAHIDGVISDDMVHFLNTIDLNNINGKSMDDIIKNLESGKFKLHYTNYFRLPRELKIYAFDFLSFHDPYENYNVRFIDLEDIKTEFPNLIEQIKQFTCAEKIDENLFYNNALHNGAEGIVIRYDKPYKFGRSTAKEHLIYKRVPQPTFDGKIIAINQATVVNPDAEKKINELGRSVTSKKIGDRILIEKAKDFQVEMIPEGQTEAINFGVSMAGFDDKDRKRVWLSPEYYIGIWIEFKCKAYNGIGKPKSAVFIRFREDKDDK